ncbi:hypothetical protein PLCT1_00256 [Planctomycetaceae bacterium]|nr:hypothetical protein PLCT1_00256 [Planctomycetaceae bacterium]
MRLKALVLPLALLCISSEGLAQRTAPGTVALAPGSRARVKAQSMVAPLVANFLEQRGDTLVFIEDDRGRGLWTFALSQVERLETTAGEGGRNQRYVARGAMFGGAAGLVGGLAFAAAASPSDTTREYSKPMTALVGAALGAGVGAIIGSRFKTERWVNVPLPRQFSFVPNRRGGFTLSIGLR